MEDRINWQSPKFNEEDRNFKTRLLFIDSIFSNLFDRDDILGRCIQHKLKWNYDEYMRVLNRSVWNLSGADPIEIMKKIDK